jgi:hypothetical protein
MLIAMSFLFLVPNPPILVRFQRLAFCGRRPACRVRHPASRSGFRIRILQYVAADCIIILLSCDILFDYRRTIHTVVAADAERAMEKRENPRPGELYRHFKNRMYQVIAVARDAETRRLYVVYQALYGGFGVWIRPLENFMSPVDRSKYPESVQDWRFERVLREEERQEGEASERPVTEEEALGRECPDCASRKETESEKKPSALLLRFLDAEDPALQQEILTAGRFELTQSDLNSIYTICGLPEAEGDIAAQAAEIIQSLRIRERYEVKRRSGSGEQRTSGFGRTEDV